MNIFQQKFLTTIQLSSAIFEQMLTDHYDPVLLVLKNGDKAGSMFNMVC